MDKTRYLELLRADGDALAIAGAENLGAHVPSCPEWDVAELIRHTGQVHRHKSAIVRHGGAEYPPGLEPEEAPGDDRDLIAWYRAGLDNLIETLSAADPEAAAWSWSGDHRAAFWNRRMAQETAVHRWDAQNAVGNPGAIDAELAADGIDEMLAAFIPGEDLPYEGPAGRVHLQCSDVEEEWTVTLRAGAVPTHEAGHSGGNVTVKGSAQDLLLLLWRRKSPDDVEVAGDDELLRSFWDYLTGPGQ